MADKEINIKVTANIDDAKKGIAEVTNELEKMSTSGSGKAADELDKVTEAADKAGDATDKLVSSWEAYKQNVRDAEAEVRKLNATQFENAEQRDNAINALGDKLDELVYEGKAIEDSVKAIGVSPESLQGFDSIAAMLNRANKEFEIALNYKEKLLNQPAVPANALVTTNPWEEGPDGGGPAEFKARMEEMRAELEAYATQMGNAIAANDQMKSALEAELASLDKSSAGYAEQKKLLEGLISACDSYAVSSETQRQSIQKQKDSLDELNKETLKSENWEEGLKSLDKYGESVVATSLKVQKSVGSQIAIQNRYENAVLSAQQKELKGQVKLQAQMEMAGKSREELIRLVEEYGKALAKAQTKEEYKAAAAGISAARKQLTLLTREASLTGSAMIGAQTSVQGLVSTIGRLGVQGRLTFKALSDGIKLFAKATVVLAAIQFAWEGISWAMEKAKTAIFGAADAEEKAKQKAEDLAKAAKAAADNLANANEALKGWESDKIRADQAQAYADAIAAQNDKYKEQLRLIDEATAADLRRVALNADGKEKEIALEKLKLQREKMTGIISEYDYQKKMIELETRLVSIRGNAKVDSAAIKEEDARKRADEAAKQLESAMMEKSDFDKFVFSPAQMAAMVAQYGLDEAKIKKYEHQYKERNSLRNELPQRQAAYKELLESGQYDAAMALGYTIKTSEEKLKKLNEVLHEVDGLINRSVASFNSMPEQIRNALETEDEQAIKFALEEYGKNYQTAETRDKDIKKRQDEAAKAVEKADQAVLDASAAKINAMQDASNADTFRSKQAEEEMATLKAQQAERNADKASQKKIDNAKKRVKKMEFDYLQRQEREMRAWAEMYGEETPEGKRRRSLASVYTAEYTSRFEAGQNARN